MSTIKVDVVSAEEQIFSGDAEFVALPGEAGELGILPQHAPLISLIKPGFVRITMPGSKEVKQVFVAGGVIEVQPQHVTVLIPLFVPKKWIAPRRKRLWQLLAKRAARLRAKPIWPSSMRNWLSWLLKWQLSKSSNAITKRKSDEEGQMCEDICPFLFCVITL